MKLIYQITAIFFLVFFTNYVYSEPSARNLIKSNTPFHKDGVVSDDIENGIINGIVYRFYFSDGSGSFSGKPGNDLSYKNSDGNWSVGCKKDKIDDSKYCYMWKNNIWIYTSGKNRTIVSIGYDHYPKSEIAIRINDEKAITQITNSDGRFTEATSRLIISKLKTAKTITTRHMKWPYKHYVDDSFELYGFNETFEYINWAITKIK